MDYLLFLCYNLINIETEGIMLEYITSKNAEKLCTLFGITAEKIMKYDCIYNHELLCITKYSNGSIFLVTDSIYSEIALKNGFTESNTFGNSYEHKCNKIMIQGYKNYGSVEINGKPVYWICKASDGEDLKFPRKLDYYQISEAEYCNKCAIEESIKNNPILMLDTQVSRNSYNEKEKIKCAILGIETLSDTTFTDIINTDNPEKKLPEKTITKTNAANENFELQISESPEDGDEDYEEEDAHLSFLSRIFNMDDKKVLFAGGGFIALLIILFIFSSIGKSMKPNMEMMSLSKYYNINKKDEVVLVYNSEVLDRRGLYFNNTVYVDYDFVHDYLNERLYYDKNENLMLYTTSNAVIEMHNGKKEINVGGGKQSLSAPAYQITNNGKMWVNLDFISKYSPFTYQEFSLPYRVSITNYSKDTVIKTSVLPKNVKLRYKGNKKSEILYSTLENEPVIVEEDDGRWAKVSTMHGITGYIENKYTKNIEETSIKKNTFEETFNRKEYNGKICMLWHQVTNKDANNNISSIIEKSNGINIICPTWFYLNDSKGNIADIGSVSYVEQCHNNNIFVWGLVSNLENKNADYNMVLSKTSLRRNLVNNIIAVAKKYRLDGINIDFEALSNDNSDSFIQFIRELSVGLDQTNVVLSVDNYVPSDYTEFYNRSEQAKFADYIIMMGYDEHTSSSKEAGSVASMPWVSDGLKKTLENVPASQLILGVPLFTRVWKTIDGKLSSEAIGIEAMMNLIEAKDASTEWNNELGQFYVTYTDAENHFCQIWAEEANSISLKLKLMRENNISGAAFWKSGLEPQSLWTDIIKGYSNQDSNAGNEDNNDTNNSIIIEDVVNPSNIDAMEIDNNLNNTNNKETVNDEK